MNIHEFREFISYIQSQGIPLSHPLDGVMIRRFRAAKKRGAWLSISVPGPRRGRGKHVQ